MRFLLLIFIFSVPLIIGCQEKEIIEEKDSAIIWTLPPQNIDSLGALFKGEIIGKTSSPITSYGFVCSVYEPNSGSINEIIVGKDTSVTDLPFQVYIDDFLTRGLEYRLRAFLTTGSDTIYGNNVKLFSKGSAKTAWSFKPDWVTLLGSLDVYGFSNSINGYLLGNYNYTYQFDPGSQSFWKINEFPYGNAIGSGCTFASIDDVCYMYIGKTRGLYKLENGNWSIQSTSPFSYDSNKGFHYGFGYNNQVFILNAYESYSYSPATNEWKPLSNIPLSTGTPVGGTQLNDKVYIITSNKNILEYDIQSNFWKAKTKYPGKSYNSIISFSYNNNIYFGLSTCSDCGETKAFDRSLWSYDPVKDEWNQKEPFPIDISPYEMFRILTNGSLYLGFEKYDGGVHYSLWKLDLSKI
jgi:hypothetical protein